MSPAVDAIAGQALRGAVLATREEVVTAGDRPLHGPEVVPPTFATCAPTSGVHHADFIRFELLE